MISRLLRDTRLPVEHRSGPATPASLLATPKGNPKRPHAWTGNHGVFQWRISIPALNAAEVADFSSLYPDAEFTYGGEPWLHLVTWDSYPLNILSATVMSAPNLGLGTPGTFASLGITLHAFANSYASKSNQRMERGDCALDPSSGSMTTACSLDHNLAGALTLESFNRPILGMRAVNTDGSPSVAGEILLVVSGIEYGQVP